MSYAAFEAEVAKVNDILCAVNLLVWDSRTMMPSGAAEARGRQLGTLVGSRPRDRHRRHHAEGHRQRAHGTHGNARRATSQGGRSTTRRGAIATLGRIPARLVKEAAERRTEGQAVWIKARAENDFAAFAPVLERTVALQREIAEHVGYAGHPYDAACSAFEPDITWAQLKDLYAELKSAIGPLLQAALQAPPARVDVLERTYPIEKQKAFSKAVAARMGYDFERGRLDDTVHPFEISFTRTDARITGRFRENWLPGGLFAVWHEAGHGIYEQGVSPDFTRSVFTTDFVNLYAVGGTSFGMHELQSRLWENRVGRSRRFWEQNFGALQGRISRPARRRVGRRVLARGQCAAPEPDPGRGRRTHLRPAHHLAFGDRGRADGRQPARRRPSGDLGGQGPHAISASMCRPTRWACCRMRIGRPA